MNKRITKIANRILISSLLILAIDLVNSDMIAKFYGMLVYVLGLSGIIISFVLKYLRDLDVIKDKLFEVIDTLSVIWTFFLIFYAMTSFVLYPAQVNGRSMEPNYDDKDIIFIWHLKFQPSRFDVVFVNVTNDYYYHPHDEYFLKRIIGLPGEKIDYINEKLYVDGEVFETDFLTKNETYNFVFDDVCHVKDDEDLCDSGVIPEGYYFVLGDHRDNSTDSRRIGLVREEDIFGKSIFNLSKVFK